MWCSTISTTTMASSTTSPMASTRPKSERVLMENPKQREQGEGADQRHRHRQQRNQGRPPALQENEHHEDDQHDGLDQRVFDFLHALGDRQRGVERDDVVQVGRKALLERRHELLGAVGGVHGIGAGQLVECDQGAGFAVEPRELVVILRAQLNAGDIPNAHNSPRSRRATRFRRIAPRLPGGPATARCR